MFHLVIACLLASSTVAPPSFAPAVPWSEPIADYLARGAELHPDGFNRAITALMPEGDRLWIGYGDATKNLGTPAPIEFRYLAKAADCTSCADPKPRLARVLAEGQGAPQRTPFDTGEEQIEPFRICDGRIWQAGVDSNDPDELWTQAKPAPAKLIEGNMFVLEPGAEPAWRKYRAIPGGEHVHDVCAFRGALYAVGSGSANRVEWEGGQIFRHIWRSDDGGKSWTVAHREMFPELGKGDTRYRRLLAVGERLYAFGYVNPFVDKGPLEGRHVEWRDGAFMPISPDTAGELANLIVTRTWNLDAGTGLVIARGQDASAPTRAFLARDGRFMELEGWRSLRAIDLAPVEGGFLLACGSGATAEATDRGTGEAETFEVRFFTSTAPDATEPVLALGTTRVTAIAVWDGALLVGTGDGAILRAATGG